MSEIEQAAKELVDYLQGNAGLTDEWPVGLVARDDEASEKLCLLTNNLTLALDKSPERKVLVMTKGTL